LPTAIVITVLTLVVAALTGCDPGFTITVRNDTIVPIVLSGRDAPITEKFRRLAAGQETGFTRLDSVAKKFEENGEPVFDVVATDPQGRSSHIALTRAELEAHNFRIVFRNEDFAGVTPTAPK
jgi:hypothetical protein